MSHRTARPTVPHHHHRTTATSTTSRARPRFSAVALVKALPTQARDHNPVSSQETVVTLSHPVLARGVVEALHHEVHDKLLANGYFNVSAERRTRSLWPLCRPKSWGPH